jgi:hypothetical protein
MLIRSDSIEELRQLIVRQRNISEKAKQELHVLTDSTALLYGSDGSISQTTAAEINSKVNALFVKYASLPTLKEFYEMPQLEDRIVWGATFGVSSIFGSVVLRPLVELFPEFVATIRPIVYKVLVAMTHPDNDVPIIEQILLDLKFSIRDREGREIVGEQKNQMMYQQVAGLLELVAKLFDSYGIMESKREDNGNLESTLTPLGERVLFHLRDAEQYISEIGVLYHQVAGQKEADTPKILTS